MKSYRKRKVKKKDKGSGGFTIIELVIASVVSIVILLAIGFTAADNQRSWSKMYDRIYSDVTIDSHIARRTFEGLLRKSKSETLVLNESGTSIEACYYQSPDSTSLDRYFRLYLSGGDLNIEYGRLEPKETLSAGSVCSNVSSCVFTQIGASVQMILALDNSLQTKTVVSSAIMHN